MKARLKNLLGYPAFWLDKISPGKITPHGLSLVGFVLHLPVIWLIIQGYLVIAALVFIFASWFDILDGALARLQKKAQTWGLG